MNGNSMTGKRRDREEHEENFMEMERRGGRPARGRGGRDAGGRGRNNNHAKKPRFENPQSNEDQQQQQQGEWEGEWDQEWDNSYNYEDYSGYDASAGYYDAAYYDPYYGYDDGYYNYYPPWGFRGGRGRGRGRGRARFAGRTWAKEQQQQAQKETTTTTTDENNNTTATTTTTEATDATTAAVAATHPSPLVAASFGGRGRGRSTWGRGGGRVAGMLASKTWVRPKPAGAEETAAPATAET